MKQFNLVLVLLLLSFSANAQVFKNWVKKDSSFSIQPYVMLQLWAIGSFNQKVDEDGDGNFREVADRANLQIRRGRLGFRGKVYQNLKFNFVLFYDLIGRDVLSATRGGVNNPPSNLGLWDAFLTWKMSKSDLLHLTGGFFRPQIGRESITSGWNVNSFEKSWSQSYIRDLLVGTGPGRAVGLNLGGQKRLSDITLSYNLGAFNPQNTGDINNSQGFNWSPLFVFRVVTSYGDPEQETYGLSYTTNYFNERKGVSLGLGTSQQWNTDLFNKSESYQADLLLNYGPLNFSGEIALLNRTDRSVDFSALTGFVRLGYNIIIGNKYFVEPSVMYSRFKSEGGFDTVNQASEVGLADGRDEVIDVGINWYLNKNRLKVALHYTAQDGRGVNNQFTRQSGIGSIRRGDYLGLGVTAIF